MTATPRIHEITIATQEQVLHLTIPRELGGSGFKFPQPYHRFMSAGAEVVLQAALAFNSTLGRYADPCTKVTIEAKQRIADLVVRHGKMIGGNFF